MSDINSTAKVNNSNNNIDTTIIEQNKNQPKLSELYKNVNKTIQTCKENDKTKICEQQNEKLQTQKEAVEKSREQQNFEKFQKSGRDGMKKYLDPNTNSEMREQLRQSIQYIDLTDLGIVCENDGIEAEYKELLESSLNEYTTEIGKKVISIKDEVIQEIMTPYQEEIFKKSFSAFKTKTQSIDFTFQTLYEAILKNHPLIKKAKKETVITEENIIRDKEKTERNNLEVGSDAEAYMNTEADYILQKTVKGGRFGYLVSEKEKINEPFSEVIQFVQNNGTGKLSIKAYEAYINVLKDSRRPSQEKWLKAKVKNVNKYGKKNPKNLKKFRLKQQKFTQDETFYQLGMYKIAQRAEKIINNKTNEKNTETEEKLNITNFIKGLNGESQADKIKVLKNIENKNHHSYTVKNYISDHIDSSTYSEITSRITFGNVLIDQIANKALMVMVFANILIGVQSGDWNGVAPLIIGGLAGSAFITNGVANSGFEKMLYPERMLNSITKESFNNKYYPEFFGNEWEVSLAQNINWPKQKNKKSMLTDLRKLEKKDNKKKFVTNPDGTETKLSVGSGLKNSEIKERFEENLSISDLRTEGSMSKYLDKENYVGPDGNIYTKEEYLDAVERNSNNHKKSNKNKRSDHVRFSMYKKIAGRIGSNDSYIPFFNQLHEHYKKNKKNKKNK